jgi:hypothetical protein
VNVTVTIDGFWLPRDVRALVVGADTPYDTLTLANGRPAEPGAPRAVTARWPRLQPEQGRALLAALRENRRTAPQGEALWTRLGVAVVAAGRRLADPNDPLRAVALAALPSYTGYSEPMIRSILGSLDMMPLAEMTPALTLSLTRRALRDWQQLPGLPGRVRFRPANHWQGCLARLPGLADRSLWGRAQAPETIVGYGSGNVPGAALLMVLLSLATALVGGAPPAVLIKNSRREPIFSRLVLEALEAADPELVSTTALLVWDYSDVAVQDALLGQADLVLAAASDETIAQIGASIRHAAPARAIRYHAHGHKVSFAAVGREVLRTGLGDPASGQALLDIVTLLSALDSVYWDQHGCLSARVHFVEQDGDGHYSAVEYAARLCEQLRLLAVALPRGAWPRQEIRDRYDRCKLLEGAGLMQVLSGYDDEFLVAVDRRPATAATFAAAVNDCRGRVILVRPVDDLMEIPTRYLSLLPAQNLQSLSVAVGQAGQGLTPAVLRFAAACAERGVTALRTVGRGAFPQLAYSWDGLLPADLVRRRPAGRFTSIEFDAPYDQMLATYAGYMERADEFQSSSQV